MSEPSAATPKICADQIALLQQGEHLCSVYAETGEMLTQVVPYVKAGLLNGERCIYVTDEHSKDTLIGALRMWRVDVQREMDSGRLVFWTRHNYRQPGIFDLNTMVSFIRRTLHEAVAEGHKGVRLAVEMSWTIDNGISDDDLVRWEDFINSISYPGSQVSFICQYNQRLLSPTLITKALHVHPVVVLGHDICPNLYCRPATEVLLDQDNSSLDSLLTKIQTPLAMVPPAV